MCIWIHVNSSHMFASRTFLLFAQLHTCMLLVNMMMVPCINYFACLVTFVNDEPCKLHSLIYYCVDQLHAATTNNNHSELGSRRPYTLCL